MPADNLYTMGKVFDTLGRFLIKDDIKDLGHFSYYGRPKGDPHIGWGTGNHPSPVHHWQLGSVMVVLGHLMGVAAVGRQAALALEEVDGMMDEEFPDEDISNQQYLIDRFSYDSHRPWPES